ncbi:hypothetical protein SAMN04487888_11810 [Eubacterium callanderi]|uniref:hypothetical protein n=1 Tax=Eubacterium callanderi TaxID=53442 RepID=UPI0008E16E06|nr:hypothetical protein [Eubacterium callanderi]SFP69563.1 hypothetical protein SAMN04487888_11810 [Eubacterium callanderi]
MILETIIVALPILALILALTPFILIYYRWTKNMDKRESIYIVARIRNLKLDKDMLYMQGKVDKYPVIFKRADDVLSLGFSKRDFTLGKIETKRIGISDLINDKKEYDEFWSYLSEIQDCFDSNDEDVCQFLKEVIELKQYIVRKKDVIRWMQYRSLDYIDYLRIKLTLKRIEKNNELNQLRKKDWECSSENLSIALTN